MSDHAPIQQEYRDQMNALGQAIDEMFNGPKLPGIPRKPEVVFVLLTFKFGQSDNGRVNYLSNGERGDVTTAMRELLARFDGRYVEP